MAFIISKKSKRNRQLRKLYYLVENYRQGKKVKRKTMLPLKEYNSVAELLKYEERQKAQVLEKIVHIKNTMDDYRQHGKLPPRFIGSSYDFVKIRSRFLEERLADLEQCEREINKVKSFL